MMDSHESTIEMRLLSLILPMPCLAHVSQITESIGIVVGLREGNVGADTCLRRDIGALAGV